MVSSHITADEKHQIILDRKSCDASAHHDAQDCDMQLGMNRASPLAVGAVPPPANGCTASMQSLGNSRCFTKLTAVAIVAAYIVSSASAFTQPHNQIGATPVSRPPVLSSPRTEDSLPSFSSRTRLFLSSNGSGKTDQNEWKAVFLTLQLYKAAFGDLKVPTKFVVPAAAPWPGT